MSSLIIFVKEPVVGRVKTRLGEQIGFEKAREVYVQMLDVIISSLKSFESVLYVEGDFSFFTKYRLRLQRQVQEDLGKRMFEAIKQELENNDKVLLIGSDVPDWSKDDIEEALDTLDKNDIVLGPSVDGGYYLVGMSKAHDIFGLEEWSHHKVLEQTLAICRENGLSVGLLKEKRDVDRKEDLDFYKGIGRNN